MSIWAGVIQEEDALFKSFSAIDGVFFDKKVTRRETTLGLEGHPFSPPFFPYRTALRVRFTFYFFNSSPTTSRGPAATCMYQESVMIIYIGKL